MRASPRAGLRPGRSKLPAERASEPAERLHDPEAAREAALKLLDRRRLSRVDLTRRLRDKGFDGAIVTQVVERLAGVGLVDDVEYARTFISERWGRRTAGWRRLEQELRGRGIAAEDIDTARARLVAEQGGADEVRLARRVVSQAERRYAGLEPRVRRQRLYALLVRRGFDGDTIEQALRNPTDD
ncbi:MAG TPA: regulatory protein RecX [Candidatus Eisenbacteria bacterium]|nr:regulatory protein RecX [Candidatus Eisenbacteria bacterium]